MIVVETVRLSPPPRRFRPPAPWFRRASIWEPVYQRTEWGFLLRHDSPYLVPGWEWRAVFPDWDSPVINGYDFTSGINLYSWSYNTDLTGIEKRSFDSTGTFSNEYATAPYWPRK